MAKIDQRRIGEYLQTALRILVEHGDSLSSREVLAQVGQRLQLSEYEKERYEKTGNVRWWAITHLYSIGLVKAGWLRKHKGVWYVTEEGKSELNMTPEQFIASLNDAYKKWRKLNPKKIAVPSELDEEETAIISDDRSTVYQEAESSAREEIAEYIKALAPFDFQDLVAALFRGMGYYTPFQATRGKDGGIDVIAYKDPIGAMPPRIRIQVKHRADTKVTRAEVGDLISNLKKDGSVGVIVSTGGFSPDALMKTREANEHIEAIDLNKFISLWEEHYDALSMEDKSRLPLRRISFLAPEED